MTNYFQQRKSPAFLFQNGRSQTPRPNPFATPQTQRKMQLLPDELPPALEPPPPLPPRRRQPSPNPLTRSAECEDLIQLF